MAQVVPANKGNPNRIPGAPPLAIGGAPHPLPNDLQRYQYNENLDNSIWEGLDKEYTVYALIDTMRHTGYPQYLGDADTAILNYQSRAYMTPSNIPVGK